MNGLETLEQAGYEHLRDTGDGTHFLKNLTDSDNIEVFQESDVTGWGLIYESKSLEFCRSASEKEILKYL